MDNKPAPNMKLVSIVLFGMTIIYPVAGVVLSVLGIIPPRGFIETDDSQRGLFSIVFVLVGLSMGVASFVLPRIMAGVSSSTEDASKQVQSRIIGMALAEGAGSMGIVLLVLLGDLMLPFVLWAVGLVAFVPHLREPH